MQQKALDSIESSMSSVELKQQELEIIQQTINDLDTESSDPLEHVMNFIQNMQQFQANSQKKKENSKKEPPNKANNKKKPKKKQEKDEDIIVDRETYKRSRSEIKKIVNKYTDEKLLDTSSASSRSDRRDKSSDHKSEKDKSDRESDRRSDASGSDESRKRSRRSSSSGSRKNSDASDESAPSHPKKPKGNKKPKLGDSEGSDKAKSESEEEVQKSEHESEEDEMLQDTPEEKLERQITEKEDEIARVQKEIQKLRKYASSSVTEETMLKDKCQQYDPIIRELVDKNLVGSAKIETLFGKVRKSREKIDQVLNDLLIYQKEFETIQISKKSKPLKLKISRKIMETRLDCYKNYLLHLQSVIEDLERQIREFKRREKEYKKQAKIAGVGVAQKHNTYADQLKQKILMLETQIEKDLKEDTATDGKKKKKVKSKGILDKRGSKSTVRTQNVAKDLK